MKLVFIGPPGAGKGLQGKIFSEELQIPTISTGDIFRDLTSSNTPLSSELSIYLKCKELAPDSFTTKIVKNRISKPDCSKGFILDGFPRTLGQAENLEKITGINHVFDFQISDEKVIKRLPYREQCRNCKTIYGQGSLAPKKEHICNDCNGLLFKREDDKKSGIVINRLAIYHREIELITDFYRLRSLLRNVDAAQNYKQVSDDIRFIINKW